MNYFLRQDLACWEGDRRGQESLQCGCGEEPSPLSLGRTGAPGARGSGSSRKEEEYHGPGGEEKTGAAGFLPGQQGEGPVQGWARLSKIDRYRREYRQFLVSISIDWSPAVCSPIHPAPAPAPGAQCGAPAHVPGPGRRADWKRMWSCFFQRKRIMP